MAGAPWSHPSGSHIDLQLSKAEESYDVCESSFILDETQIEEQHERDVLWIKL